VTWFNKRYGHAQDNADWLKLHQMCGVTTNIVTGVEVSGRHDHDGPFMPALVEATARNFNLREVAADKAYSSVRNLETIVAHGATPYVPFKTRATGESKSALWNRLWGLYTYRRDEFLTHYHKRSNSESTFSMIKAKFGGKLRSKTAVARVNEAMCKVLAHNLCVLVQSIYELGIEASFQNAIFVQVPTAS
jgi:transposase